MASGTYDVLENKLEDYVSEIKKSSSSDLQKVLEGVQSLARKIEDMKRWETSKPQEFAEIHSCIDKIILLLGAQKAPSQSPLLDQLVDELQILKNSTPSTSLDIIQRLTCIEKNLVHVIANVGYDILATIQKLFSQRGISTDADHPPEPVWSHYAFSDDPQVSKQENMLNYMQFLGQIPREEEGASTSYKSPPSFRRNVEWIDKKIHFSSPVPLYEVCPIEVIFKNFERLNDVTVIINFTAAASYTNCLSSVFVPNCNGPIPVQIPWMNMENIQVIGKGVAEIQFSSKTRQPIHLQMNVLDSLDNSDRVIIFGRDFVERHVQSVHHDRNIVILKALDAFTTVEKPFVYLANALRDVETKFCRYRLKEEVKDVEHVQDKINRYQRVLVQHTQPSDQTPEHQTEKPKSPIIEKNVKTSDLEENSVPQKVEDETSKSSGQVMIEACSVMSCLLPENTPQQIHRASSSKDAEKESVSSLPTNVCSVVLKEMPKEDSKSSSQPMIPKKDAPIPASAPQVTERKTPKATVQSPGSEGVKNVKKGSPKKSSPSKKEKEMPATKKVSSVSEKIRKFPWHILEKKISNISGPLRSFMEEELVKLSSKLMETSKPTVTSKFAAKMDPNSEGKLVEPLEGNLELDLKQLFETCSDETELAELLFAQVQCEAHKMRCARLSEKQTLSSENIVSKLPTMEKGEKTALDPTRERPPVVKKKDGSELTESCIQFAKKEETNKTSKPSVPAKKVEKIQLESVLPFEKEDQKTGSGAVMDQKAPMLCLRNVDVKKENKPTRLYLMPQKPSETPSSLVPTSVVKKQIQESPSTSTDSK